MYAFGTQRFPISNLSASFIGQHKRLIWSPPVAVFPHPLASDLSFSRYCKSYIGNICTSHCVQHLQSWLIKLLICMSCFSCRYWNYLRKQTFVLESYVSKVNWIMNRALFGVHCYLSWGFVCPFVMALVHIATTLRAPYSGIVKEASESSCGQCPVSL